jgi:hypothetical protein
MAMNGVTFQVLVAARWPSSGFVALCNVLESYLDSKASIIALTIEAASTSETSVNFHQTTRSNKPEDSHPLAINDFGRDSAANRDFEIFPLQRHGYKNARIPP